jgi:hypothetical protein
VAEAKGSFAHLILNPGAGGAAASLGRLSEAARESGIRVGVLEPGEVVRHAALAAAEDGAQVLGVAGGDGSVAGVAAQRGLPRGGAHGHAQPLRQRPRAGPRAPAWRPRRVPCGSEHEKIAC